MIAGLLASVGVPFLARLVGGALREVGGDVANTAADALDKVDDAIKGGQITPEQIAEANRHVETMTKLENERETSILSTINETIRSEGQSDDQYVRRWRPTWGYITAWSWAAQSGVICLAVIGATIAVIAGHPGHATVLLDGLSKLIDALTLQWGIALTVLGVAIKKRSDDKIAAAGVEAPPGVLGRVIGALTK